MFYEMDKKVFQMLAFMLVSILKWKRDHPRLSSGDVTHFLAR